MGSSGNSPPLPTITPVELPPPPMQESPYARGSAARKSNAALAAGLGMGGTLISKRAGAATADAAPENLGKTLLGT